MPEMPEPSNPVKPPPPRAVGLTLVALQLGLFVLTLRPPSIPGLPQFLDAPPEPWRLVAGIACGLVGAIFLGLGALHLGDALTPDPTPKDDTELVDSGVYAWVRHPIYTGFALMALAITLYAGSSERILFCTALWIVLDVKSRVEERYLLARFADYAAYRERVRRLVPFVY